MEVTTKCKLASDFRDCLVNSDFIKSMLSDSLRLLKEFILEEHKLQKLQSDSPVTYVNLNRLRLLVYYTLWYLRFEMNLLPEKNLDIPQTLLVREVNAFLKYKESKLPIPFYIAPYSHTHPESLTESHRQALAAFYDDVGYVANFVANSKPVPGRWSDGHNSLQQTEKRNTTFTEIIHFVDGMYSMRDVYKIHRGRTEFKKRLNNRFHINVYNYMYLERTFPHLLFSSDSNYSQILQLKSDTLVYKTDSPNTYALEILREYNDGSWEVKVRREIFNYVDDLHRNARFIVLFPTLVFTQDKVPTGMHANVLFYNSDSDTVEVFDPHIPHETVIKQFGAAYVALAKELFGTSHVVFHERINLQELQEEEYGASVTECGNCASWTLWYAEMRLAHYTKSVSEFISWLHEYEIAPRMSTLYTPEPRPGRVRMGRYFTDLAKDYVDHIHNTYNIIAASTHPSISKSIYENVDTSLSKERDGNKLSRFYAGIHTYPTGYIRPPLPPLIPPPPPSNGKPKGIPPPMTTRRGTPITTLSSKGGKN